MASIAEEASDAGDPAPARAKRWRFALPEALPPLRGPWLSAFRILWFAALAAALLATVGGLHYHNVIDEEWGEPYSELGLRAVSPTGTDLGLPIGEETRRAGVAPRSKLVAIDGVKLPAKTTLPEVAARLRSVPGDHVRIRTRLADGSEREHRLRRADHVKQAYAGNAVSGEAKHKTQTVLSLIAAVMMLGAALLLYRKAAGAPIASLLSLTLLTSIVVAEPGRSIFTYFALQDLWAKVIALSAIGYLLIMFGFPSGRMGSRWTWLAITLYALIVLFPSSNPVVALVQTVAMLSIVLFALAHLGLRYRRLPPSMERQQLRWAFLGFATSLAGGAIWIALLLAGSAATSESWRIWALIGAEVAMHLSTILLIACILVALLRYRLYDAETVISRSTGYAVLTLLLGGTFAASSKGLEWAFETGFGGDAGALPGATGAGLAVVLITPLHNRVHRWAERRFQKALMRLKRDLPDCVDDLRETATLAELTEEVLDRVVAGIRTSRAAVLVGDQVAATRGVPALEVAEWRSGNALDRAVERVVCNYGDPFFPARVPLRVRHGAHLVGWLLLGPRPDGSFYGRDEQEALAEIADPVARAVQIVLLRDAREARARRQGEEQEKRLSALERQLAAALRALSATLKPEAGPGNGTMRRPE
jgi:hypothetical protein